MIVIPEVCRFLAIRIVVGCRFSADVPIFRITVAFGGRLRSVQVRDGTHGGIVLLGSVYVMIDRQKMFRGQVVCPLDAKAFVAPCFDGWPRRASAKTPAKRRRNVAVDFL